MGSENERVKTLLMDTVTLLCKNSLKYQHELCIEGLLGIKLDMNDVFFVHISEKFTKQCDSTGDKRDGEGRDMGADNGHHGHKDDGHHPHGHQPNNSGSDGSMGNNQHLGDSRMVHGDDLTKAALLAGQRRAPRKPSSPHRNVTTVMYPVCSSTLSSTHMSDSDMQSPSMEYQSREEHGNFGVFDNNSKPHFDQIPVPHPAKRHKENPVERSVSAAGGTTLSQHSQSQSQTPWPNIAGHIELPNQSGTTTYLEQVDIHPVNNTNSLVQPGCSTWTSQSQPSTNQPTDPVISPQPFLLAVPDTVHILTPPRYTPSSVALANSPSKRLHSNSSSSTSKRRREWNGKYYFCDFCRYQTKRLWNLQRHTKKHSGVNSSINNNNNKNNNNSVGVSSVRCLLCRDEVNFASNDELRKHIELRHKDVTKLEEQLNAYRDHEKREADSCNFNDSLGENNNKNPTKESSASSSDSAD